MQKPQKKEFKAVYEYHEIIDYIEAKYKIRVRHYKEEVDGKYRDFWHWMLDAIGGNVSNGCFIYVPLLTSQETVSCLEDGEEWVEEILKMITDEFGEDGEEGCLKVWLEW